MFTRISLVLFFVIDDVLCISNRNGSQDINEALLDLSNIAIEGRQRQSYYAHYDKYPPYYQNYKPHYYQYGYRPPYFSTNEIPDSQPVYSRPLYSPPSVFKKTQESVMDALFSIAQNDDLQCVPLLLCEATSGGLTGRQGGANLPVSLNLDSLVTLLSGLNSANMSPVLHFGKAALLGFTSKGNARSCRYAYPDCPNDPEKLIRYLNNHNGGFFRFFQGLNTQQNHGYPQNYAQYFNRYVPAYSGKSIEAEKRIQNRPGFFVSTHEDNDYKEHRGFVFSGGLGNDIREPNKVAFPQNEFKFPLGGSSTDPFRRGKKLTFLQQSNLDIQRPLPNHVPSANIFPDRTGTGELKLDPQELESYYQENSPYDFDQYNQLLYDSFPSDRTRVKSHSLSFPTQ